MTESFFNIKIWTIAAITISLLTSCASRPVPEQKEKTCHQQTPSNLQTLNACLKEENWSLLNYHAKKVAPKNKRIGFYYLSLFYMNEKNYPVSQWYIDKIIADKEISNSDEILFQKAQLLWLQRRNQEAFEIFQLLADRGYQPAYLAIGSQQRVATK